MYTIASSATTAQTQPNVGMIGLPIKSASEIHRRIETTLLPKPPVAMATCSPPGANPGGCLELTTNRDHSLNLQ